VKKRKTDEEITAELLEKDENFRRLYDKVRELNGGRIPSTKEIDFHIQEWRARRASS
jgi:hypothetical protein